MRKEGTRGADDGSDRSSSGSEDHEYEVSPRIAAQVSTGGLHSFGSPSSIHMENNSDVHIGSRLHYNAPVTINQYVSVLGNGDETQNSILHEAVKAPIHGLDTSKNIPQGKTVFGRHSVQIFVTLPALQTVVLRSFPHTLHTNFGNMDDRPFWNLSLLLSVVSPFHSIFYASDAQLAARGSDPARGLIYSGPRQVTGLVRLVKVSISAKNYWCNVKFKHTGLNSVVFSRVVTDSVWEGGGAILPDPSFERNTGSGPWWCSIS
jgi:hypothetical protein